MGLRKRVLVRVQRKRFDDEGEYLDGFVVAVDRKWFCMHLMDNSMMLDGFSVFRVADISLLDVPQRRHLLHQKILRWRNSRMRKPRSLDLTSTRSILETAQADGIVTIYRERFLKGACWIGVARCEARTFRLLEIDCDGKWDGSSSEYRYKDVTRIEFGDAYSESLAANVGWLDSERLRVLFPGAKKELRARLARERSVR